MPSIVLYLVKCMISLAIVWLFYQLLLRRLTFYVLNRWYLLGYALLSFLLPLIHIAVPAEEEMTGNLQVIRYIPVITGQPSVRVTQAAHAAYSGWDILLWALALGAVLLLGRLLIRCLSLRRIRRGATLIKADKVAIYQVDELIIPFSFGNAIYINPQLHSEKECEEIILHEYVHVRQRHTMDILLAELLCIVSWYNPFSWLIRHSIRQNLEFIADRQVLSSGLDRRAYQYHLLKVVGESRYLLANNFNFSSLKKRIVMMNKTRSARLHLVKFLFLVPLLGVLLAAFRDKVTIHLPAAIEVHQPRKVSDTSPAPSVLVRSVSKDTARPMYVIDEVEASEGTMKKLNPAEISFVDIMKNESAVSPFGPRAEHGIVLIFTKAYASARKNEVTLKDGKKVRLAVPTPPPPGIPPPPPGSPPPPKDPAARDTLPPQLMRPTAIEEIDYDSVKVGNDSYSAHGTSISFSDTTSPDYKPTASNRWLKEALIIVDGKPCAYEDLRLDPNKAASVTIIKNQAALAIYGSRGAKGVVLITTKQPS